jgi:hypothetical protein
MGKSIGVCLLAGIAITLSPGPGFAEDALKDVKAGWYQELVYEQELLNPTALCYDAEGNLYVYDQSRQRLNIMPPGGKITALPAGDGLRLRALAWQPNRGRLLGFDLHAVYSLRDGRFVKIRDLSRTFLVSTVTVNPADDSIFAGNEEQGRPIVHLDADGNYIGTLKARAQGCYQLAYDESKRLLYFSETYTGSISALDIGSHSERVLIRDLAVPGTPEPIAVFLDDARTLWFYTANDGLHRFAGGRFEKIAGPMMGAGPIVWSPVLDNWIAIQYAGSNLMSYDYDLKEGVEITPYLNAVDIVEDSRGRIFYPKFDLIHVLGAGGPVPFSEPLRRVCWNLALDSHDNLYAAAEEGVILSISAAGKVRPWRSGLPAVSSLCYDRATDSLIVVTIRDDTATVSQIPIADPRRMHDLAQIEKVTRTNVLPRVTTDAAGDIYLLEWGRNEILKVNRRTKQAETLFENILATRDITVPGFAFSRHENAFVVGTLEEYLLISLETGEREILATNRHGADNLAIYEKADGTLVLIHSGQVFRLRRR